MRWARVLGAVGRVCITAGVLILLFVAYQLWGTGLREAQAQRDLEDEFAEILGGADDPLIDEDETDSSTSSSTTAPEVPTPPPPSPPEGDAAAHIVIPKIGVDKIVVEGVSLSDLKRGPGHYPDTPMPGQPGNAAIAGHRTTYGAPFNRIDELVEGDEILITTVQGTFRYTMTEQLIVSPSQIEVLDDFGDNRLTLTACHPKYTARERIIVVAELAEEPAPAPSTTLPPEEQNGEDNGDGESASGRRTIDGGLSGEGKSAWPAIWMGVICALVWIAAWLVGKYTPLNKWVAYGVGTPFFFVMLFFFYENFARLLPANY